MLQINELYTISQTCDADAIGSQCSSTYWASFGVIHTLFTNHTTNEWATWKKLQTHKQFSLDMITKLLLCSQKFETAETCDDDSFLVESPSKRSLALISKAFHKSNNIKYHHRLLVLKGNPESIFDFFRDDSSSQWISMPMLQHLMELADDVYGAEWCIRRRKVMIWPLTIRKTSRRFERFACSVPQKIIIPIFAMITLWPPTVNDVMY